MGWSEGLGGGSNPKPTPLAGMHPGWPTLVRVVPSKPGKHISRQLCIYVLM